VFVSKFARCAFGFSLVLFSANIFAQDAAAQQFELPVCGTLPVPTQMHGSTVIGDRLYILGGDSTKGWTNEVYSARIVNDSQLTGWRREADMPERRAYLANSVEAVNDRIYVIGGSTAETSQTDEGKTARSQTVLWTRVGADGTISDWKASLPFPGEPLSLLASCSDEAHLYVTGGWNGNKMSDAIYVCDLAPDGTPANWRAAAKLAQPLRFHGAAILNGRLYVWGGQHTQSSTDASKDVYSAALNGANIGTWREEAAMPAAVYSSTSCGFNDYLIAVGGRYVNGYPTNCLWFSQLQADGAVAPWMTLKTNLDTRVYHSLGLDKTRGLVFISGGKNKITPDAASGFILDKVAIFRLSHSSDKAIKAEVAKSKTEMYTELGTAMTAAARTGNPVLAFLYAPEVPDCRRAWDNVIQTPQFAALQDRFTLATIDVSSASGADTSKRISIFRVPALVQLDATGKVVNKAPGVRTWADVQALVGR
jgi:N-acetylneuraminic acid mutarotase